MAQNHEGILIVDDEASVRRLLHKLLVNKSYRCEEAANSEEAIEKIKCKPMQLVILDISMPGKSGTELLVEIRAGYPDTAVIMATATTDLNTAINCMKQGAYDYITKPFNLDEVTLSVARALEKRRLELENRNFQKYLKQKIEQQADKIRESFLNAITALAYALEAKDEYTSGHSQRVAEISVSIARELGMSRQDISGIRLAGLIHDIGKIGVKASVLNSPDRLTDVEFQHIMTHSELGEHILAPIVEDKQILRAVRHHHERYDGTGYPNRLSGKQIPLGARILAVADTYDAITSERPYRKAMDSRIAFNIIDGCKGSQFDPDIIDAFFKNQENYHHLTDKP